MLNFTNLFQQPVERPEPVHASITNALSKIGMSLIFAHTIQGLVKSLTIELKFCR